MKKLFYLLLSFIVSQGSINAMDMFYGSDLHRAAANGDFNFFSQNVISASDLSAQDLWGRPPLYLAAENGHADIVQLLIQCNANVNQITGIGNQTALHAAALIGNVVIIDLLATAKANLEQKDWNGYTALHAAALNGKVEAVKALIDHKANPFAKDKRDRTPLEGAQNYQDVEKIVNAKKAEPYDKIIALLLDYQNKKANSK